MKPFLSSRPRRTRHPLRWRFLFIIVIVLLFGQHHLFLSHRRSLAEKYAPTIFDITPEAPYSRSVRPDDEDAHFRDDLIANRGNWRVLGSGYEGEVFAYDQSVIKTFTPGRSPFRNCAPGSTQDRWPTEIAASLRFGGLHTYSNASIHENDSTNGGFVSVRAFFEVVTTVPTASKWHLVTALVDGGNIKHLAKKIRSCPEATTPRQVDLRYRPAFDTLLGHLHRLHTEGYCHDDMKPANIFVESDTKWLLGDLGNLREIDHPYHSSRLWSDNKQLKDCRANDSFRALRSYLQFIRAASTNRQEFDKEFMRGQEPWSRLYWSTLAIAPSMSAEELFRFSSAEHPDKFSQAFADIALHTSNYGLMDRMSVSSINHGIAVSRALETRMGEKIARFWAMTWLFGVPLVDPCAV